MGIETFPEIENFQHLPRRVIVKGGSSSYTVEEGAELRGIVINNIGQPLSNLRVFVVVFNEKNIPLFNTSAQAVPDRVPQGGIASFSFRFKEFPHEIKHYYLYTEWNFNDKE